VSVPEKWYGVNIEQAADLQARDTNYGSAKPGQMHKTSNTEAIGMVLYTDYVLAFELAAVLLLVAIISAITLAHRNIVRSKRQNVKRQIMTRRDERVRLVSMKSENDINREF
jgi:NADH-quinone oxidoreductase subunit J